MAAFQFIGGDVEVPEPSADALKRSAYAWSAMASINQFDGERILDTDDLVRAEQQFREAAKNLVKASDELAAARQLISGAK